MGINAFTPVGNTVKITAATSAPTPVQIPSLTLGGTQYRVYNTGNVNAFLAYGSDSGTAAANAVIPTGAGANSKFCVCLIPGLAEVFSFQPNGYFTAITSVGTADIYITPGDGL